MSHLELATATYEDFEFDFNGRRLSSASKRALIPTGQVNKLHHEDRRTLLMSLVGPVLTSC
jgi:hypothetical protein